MPVKLKSTKQTRMSSLVKLRTDMKVTSKLKNSSARIVLLNLQQAVTAIIAASRLVDRTSSAAAKLEISEIQFMIEKGGYDLDNMVHLLQAYDCPLIRSDNTTATALRTEAASQRRIAEAILAYHQALNRLVVTLTKCLALSIQLNHNPN